MHLTKKEKNEGEKEQEKLLGSLGSGPPDQIPPHLRNTTVHVCLSRACLHTHVTVGFPCTCGPRIHS